MVPGSCLLFTRALRLDVRLVCVHRVWDVGMGWGMMGWRAEKDSSSAQGHCKEGGDSSLCFLLMEVPWALERASGGNQYPPKTRAGFSVHQQIADNQFRTLGLIMEGFPEVAGNQTRLMLWFTFWSPFTLPATWPLKLHYRWVRVSELPFPSYSCAIQVVGVEGVSGLWLFRIQAAGDSVSGHGFQDCPELGKKVENPTRVLWSRPRGVANHFCP